jgi:hypothetical protein
MALNLNKDDAANSKASTEKKGLNLSKSGDSVKIKPDLKKDEVLSTDSNSSISSEADVKKKSPVIFILAIVVLIGFGIFWLTNNDGTKSGTPVTAENPSSTQENETVPITTSDPQDSTAISELENETATNNEQAVVTNTNNDDQQESNGNTNNSNSNNSSSTSEINTTRPESPSARLNGTIEEKAKQVISGTFGNGVERKRALGSEYVEIQAKVNEIYKSQK